MPRQRMYSSNAQRQAAYRARLAQRQAAGVDAGLVARIAELETALAAARRRADTAERRAADSDRDAAVAREQVAALKAAVAALQHRLDQATPAADTEPTSPMNRQARRQAERDARRRH